jgi:hypothetical protein
MKVVLVLSRDKARDLRIMVKLHTHQLKQQVASLLEANKSKEAFDLILKRAEVSEYIPSGKKPSEKPDVILMEDLL